MINISQIKTLDNCGAVHDGVTCGGDFADERDVVGTMCAYYMSLKKAGSGVSLRTFGLSLCVCP